MRANATRIRTIAWLVIIGELARSAFVFFENYYVMTHFSADGLRFDAPAGPQFLRDHQWPDHPGDRRGVQGRDAPRRRAVVDGVTPMAIRVKLDRLLLDRRLALTELADRVGITIANLSVLKTNKARAIRFSTLEALCRELQCQPGEILEWTPED